MKMVGGFYVPDVEEHMIGELEKNQGWNTETVDRFCEYCRNMGKADGTLLDIGAHVGTFALRAAKTFKRIVCFEPYAPNYDCLLMNIMMNTTTNFSAHNLAISNITARYSPKADEKYEGGNTGGTHFVLDAMGSVHSCRLDDFIMQGRTVETGKISAIKIDVEGMESMVLQGAEEVILRYSPIIMWENKRRFADRHHINLEKPADILRRLGYRQGWKHRADEVWIKTIDRRQ